MSAGSPAWLRSLAAAVHRFIAAVPPVANAYLWLWRRLAGRLSLRQRQQVLNSMATVTWPENALGSCRVTLGSGTQVKLHPHNGEFDFAAVLGGRMHYEEEVFSFLDSRIADYDAVIEIGANVGVFTVYFGKQLEQRGGLVYAFEPSRQAYARLSQNISVNGLANVSSFAVAVGAETGFATFHEPEGHLTNGSLVPTFAAIFSQRVKATRVLVVGAESLSALVDEQKRVLVKIDVEGYEAPLLKALVPFLHQVKADVLLEVLPEFEAEIDEAVKLLPAEYQRYAITRSGLQPQQNIHAVEGRDCFLSPNSLASLS